MDERYYGSNDRADTSADRSRLSRFISRDGQEAPARPQAYAPTGGMQAASQGGVMIYSPSTYEDVQLLIDHLKMREQVIVDFSTLNQASVYRILDFMSGAIYALSGSIQQINTNIFLFAPAGVTITVPSGLGGKRR